MRPLSYARAATRRRRARARRRRSRRARSSPAAPPRSTSSARASPPTEHLVDINDLPLAGVEDLPDGGLRIGALARMSDVARAPGGRRALPGDLRRRCCSAPPQQLRNMASMGGNLLPARRAARTCATAISPCNKREPGSGCSALGGLQPRARDPRHQRALHRHPPVGRRRRAGRVRRRRAHRRARTASARSRIDDFFLLPGDTPRPRASAGRTAS